MISRCSFGIHKYAINAETVVNTEEWHKTYDYSGSKVPNSDYVRKRIIKVEKCQRCGKKKAYRYLDNGKGSSLQNEELTVEFAEAEIIRIKERDNANTDTPENRSPSRSLQQRS